MLGRSIHHIKNNVLDTTCYYPSMLFEFDPATLLRVIRYMAEGFVPTDWIHDAICDWSGSNVAPHYGHLLALMIKHITANNSGFCVEYVKLLHAYGILAKIFTEQIAHNVKHMIHENNIDEVYVEELLNELRNQYEKLDALGYVNMPGQNFLHAKDLPSLMADMKVSIPDEENEMKSVPPINDHTNWPSLAESDSLRLFNSYITPSGKEPIKNESMEYRQI